MKNRHFQTQLFAAFQPEALLACLDLNKARLPPAFPLELVFPTQPSHTLTTAEQPPGTGSTVSPAGAGGIGWSFGHAGGPQVSKPGLGIPNPLKIPRNNTACCPPAGLLSLKLSLTPASSRFPPSVERGSVFSSSTASLMESLTATARCRHLPKAPGSLRSTRSHRFPLQLELQPLPSFFGENSFHGAGGKIRTASGKGPKSRSLLPVFDLHAGTSGFPGEHFSQQAQFCFHLE